MLDFSPRLRDTLTRGFWIGEEIAHAKVAKGANPTTLLTRFAEELRRAPEAGPDAGRGRRVVLKLEA